MNLSAIKQISIFFLFIILGFGIYSNTLDAPFFFDDVPAILENPHIRITKLTLKEIGKAGFKSSSARPIAYLSFALNYYFHQYNLKGYHVVNIIIHILNGIFFYLFIKTTLNVSTLHSTNSSTPESFSHPSIAFGAALVWLVHPVQTQSVTYIIQRMNSMAALLYVLSFFLYIKGRLADKSKKRWSWFTGSAVAWLFSLGCKQISATLPFFIFLYEWYFFQDLNRDWLKRHLKYLFGIITLFCFVAFIYMEFNPLKNIISSPLYAHNKFTFSERVLAQPRVVIYYLSLLFYPHPSRLNLDYDFPLSHSLIDPTTTLFALFAIIGLLGFAFYLAKKERLISFCILWFFGNLIIESSIIPLALIYEHRTYLPSMLVCLLMIMLAVRYIKPKRLIIGTLCAVVMICSAWTYERNSVWGDSVALWQDCVKKSPQKSRPHLNLGLALEDKGYIKEAKQHYSEALRINPNSIGAHNNLGAILFRENRTAEAIAHYNKALKIKPNFWRTHNNLGLALEKQNDSNGAIRHYFEALRLNPDSSEAHNNIGLSLEKTDQADKAIHHYLQALRIKPDNENAHYNLGNLLVKQGRTKMAITHYYEALRIKPDDLKAQINIANALATLGRSSEAIIHYLDALRLKPNNSTAHYNLGILHAKQGKLTEAIGHFSKTVKLDPENQNARSSLEKAVSIREKILVAIRKTEHDLALYPEDPDLYHKLGNLYKSLGELKTAIGHYKKALSIQPHFPPALNNLAIIYVNKREYDDALPLFKQIVEIVPDHAGTYYNIACIYAIQNKRKESTHWLKEAVKRGYDNWELIKSDKDLENIKKSSYYKKLIKDH